MFAEVGEGLRDLLGTASATASTDAASTSPPELSRPYRLRTGPLQPSNVDFSAGVDPSTGFYPHPQRCPHDFITGIIEANYDMLHVCIPLLLLAE